jgi:hypothetical protein
MQWDKVGSGRFRNQVPAWANLVGSTPILATWDLGPRDFQRCEFPSVGYVACS